MIMGSVGEQNQSLRDISNTCTAVQHQLLKAQKNGSSKRKLVITASGFHGQSKQALLQLAESIDATYSGDLVHGRTTHLICKRLMDCFATPKYQRALEWGIQIVTYDWLLASSAAGYALPEDDYKDDQLQALKPSPRPVRKQIQKQQAQPAAPSDATTAQPVQVQQPQGGDMKELHKPCRDSSRAAVQCIPHGSMLSPCVVAGVNSQPSSPMAQQMPHIPMQAGPAPSMHQEGQQEEEVEFAFQLSQYSLQQNRREQQDHTVCNNSLQQHAQPCGHMPVCDVARQNSEAAKIAEEASQGFQFEACNTEQVSPSVQHFQPMHQAQHPAQHSTCSMQPSGRCIGTPASKAQQQQQPNLVTGLKVEPEGITDNCASAVSLKSMLGLQQTQDDKRALQQQNIPGMQGGSSRQESPCCSQLPNNPIAAATAADEASAVPSSPEVISSPGSSHTGSISPVSRGMSPEGLLIPETQADLEEVWNSSPGSRGTPLSLKYYAMQQRSRARTAGLQHTPAEVAGTAQEESTEIQGSLGVQETDQIREEQQRQQEGWCESDQQSEEGADTEADETEDEGEQQQHQDWQLPAVRPSTASSCCSGSQQQPQELQVPDFRLTSSSKVDSTGLTRLKRRDGFRRPAGRLLVSEVSAPSEVQLEDSDCELHDELGDSDSEAYAQAVQQKQASQQMQSPMHSCSGSSLPAHSHPYTSAAVDEDVSQAAAGEQSDYAVADVGDDAQSSILPAAAAGSPAASQLTGSDTSMPVMKLSFSLGSAGAFAASQSQQQSGSFGSAASDSAATPQLTCDSSDYSPSASGGSSAAQGGDSRPASGSSLGSRRLLKLGGRDSAGNAATAAAMMQKRQQQKQQLQAAHQASEEDEDSTQDEECFCPQQQQDDNGFAVNAPLSDTPKFITRRKGGRVHSSVIQEQQSCHAAGPAAPAADAPTVVVKQEPAEWQPEPQSADEMGDWQPEAVKTDAAPDPADALLVAMRKQQQQHKVPAQQQQLRPKPKQEILDPAEQLLQNLKQRQQQQSEAAAEAGTADGIDNSDAIVDDSGWQQQQQFKPARYSTASSFATELSTVSGKVPLRILGGGQALDSDVALCGASPLERVLQVALADNAAAAAAVGPDASPAAAVTGSGTAAVKQEAVDWLHTPSDQPQQPESKQCPLAAGDDKTTDSDEDGAFEITGLPTKALAARNKPMTKQLGAHLAHLSQAGGQEQVIPLKLLSKAPRGSTAKAFHGLKPSNKLVYSDQVQVPWARATFSTKERSRCAIVLEPQPIGAEDAEDDASSSDVGRSQKQHQDGKVFLAEPVAFYKLESGEWWVELLRFYSAKDLRLLAKAADQKLHLPADFQLSYELLRGMTHEHVPLRKVQGEFKLSKVKKVPASSRSRASPFFWRYSFDCTTCQVLTDRPVTDFLVQ